METDAGKESSLIMALCSKCRKRKAKRPCPALGSSICQLCCGTLREKEIPCSSSCRFLTAHRSYQEKRILDKRTPSSARKEERRDSPGTEKAAWLAFRIEAVILEYAGARPGFSDRDVVLALEFAKDKIEKGSRRILLPGESLQLGNEAGELLFRVAESARFSSSVLVTMEGSRYSNQEKIACLDRVVLTAKAAAGNELNGRRYLEDLTERFARAETQMAGKKILSQP
jgi:hypothetical protein